MSSSLAHLSLLGSSRQPNKYPYADFIQLAPVESSRKADSDRRTMRRMLLSLVISMLQKMFFSPR